MHLRALPRLALFAALAAAPALAQQNNWTIDRVSGTAVMDEVSPLVFRVANAATSRTNIESFTIGIPTAPYDIDGATAPAGWHASSIDRRNRRVTFTAVNSCLASSNALRPGQSALFEVRVVGVPVNQDQANQGLTLNRTDVLDPCNRNITFRQPTGAWTWTLVSFGAKVTTSQRDMPVGDTVTVTLTFLNDSTATQNNITPAAPTITGTATFALVSGPTPASVTNFVIDAVSTFTWVYRATGAGTATFSTKAGSTVATSPLVTSPPVLVGAFPAAVIATPTSVVSSGTVTVQVIASNNDLAAMTNVSSTTPVAAVTGAATATRLSGPTPTSVGALAANATTAFTTTWRVTGNPGDKVTFSAGASGTLSSGTTINAAPVTTGTVTVQETTLTPAPNAVFSGSGATRIAYRVSNGSGQGISRVVLMTPDANLFRTPTAVSVPAGWTAGTSASPRGISFTSTSAAQIPAGGAQTFTINYVSIGTVTTNTATTHKAHLTFADGTTSRIDSTVTVAVNRPIADVIIPVAVATPTRVHFTWSNPSTHDGVLILRSAGAPPNTAPVSGTRYPAGTALGNATVVYEDSLSFNGSVADTGLTNGTSYYYRIYNRDEFGVYSPGSVPAASPNNYLLAIPPGTASNDALWCSTVGLPALQQPFTDLGKTVFQSTNGSFFTANTITVGAPVNGNEKWRPSLTRGVVQARPTAIRLNGATEPSLFVGDQLGYGYRVDGATGALTWTGNGGVALGEVIQAQAVVAVRSFATPAFQAAYPTDLVFFGTRNNTSRTSNSLYALRADTGAVQFRYQPGNLDQITGPVLFDFVGNTLWIASLKTGGPSLRVLDALNPAAAPLLTVTDLGDIPTGVTRNGNTNQALVVDRGGVIRGYYIPSRAQLWQASAGGTVTQPLVTYGNDFFVSTQTGVQRFTVDPTTFAVTSVWGPVAMRLPSSVRVDGTNGKIYVGDGDGFLRRLNLATGAVESSVRVSTTGGVSMPSLDTTAGLNRVYLGTADGRLCAYPVTF
ncbi:MAG: hypothetical protein U0228_33460 [Myxococcaceae bacterium]